MHYLGLALYAEGPTDYGFLCPLLRRLCEDICTRDASDLVEVSDVLSLDHPQATQEALRTATIRDHRSISIMIEVMIRDYCGRNGMTIPEQGGLFEQDQKPAANHS